MIDKLSTQNIKDVSKIHGISKETIAIMVDVYKNYLISDYKNWNKILKELNLSRKAKVLDLACGNGRTAVKICKKYGARIIGVDIVSEFIKSAKEYAKREKLTERCEFIKMDARKAVSYFKNYDIVLWLSAPHLWGGLDKTIIQLKKCCKDNGYILIYDAYYLSGSNKKKDTWCSMEETIKKLQKHGDKIVKIFDEKNYMWKTGYAEDRKAYARYLCNINDLKIKSVINKQLKKMDKTEKWETKNFGTAFWILKVKK